MREKQPAIDRFMAKVRKTASCWLWTGAKNGGDNKTKKYGMLQENYRMKYAHRWIWEYFNGGIPAGLCVMHTCDNPICVNPAHLKLGTQAENIHDRDAKGRNGNKGREVTQETREKMSKAQAGRKRTPEHSANIAKGVIASWKRRKGIA